MALTLSHAMCVLFHIFSSISVGICSQSITLMEYITCDWMVATALKGVHIVVIPMVSIFSDVMKKMMDGNTIQVRLRSTLLMSMHPSINLS